MASFFKKLQVFKKIESFSNRFSRATGKVRA
jgi:hypothetical protein